MSISQADKVGWWDRARLHFIEKGVTLLRANIEKYEQTFDVSIAVATPYVCQSIHTTRNMASQNREALQKLETKNATSVNYFAWQIMGLDTALQLLSVASVATRQADVQNVETILNEHRRVLKLCLESCTSGLKDTTARAGTQVKYARTFNEARQAIGSIGHVTGGGPPTVVEYAEARDKSIQHVGPMDTESAKAFWTSR